MKNYNVSDEPVTEVAVDINDIKDTCNEKGRNEECVFLVAGRMIYRKGLDFLFDALMRIPQETRYQVRVVGDGPELEHLHKRGKEDLNLSEHVHCMGSIPYMEMEKEYAGADVFIMPSIRETTGTVLLEAMSKGIPVITINKFGGATLFDENTGWLYGGNSKEEYIEKVTLTDKYGKVNFYLLPFVKPSMVKQIVGTDENDNNLSYDATLHKLLERENVNEAERNVLVSHQFYLPAGKAAEDIERMDSEIRTVGNIDEVSADVLERFDYAALGHIHKPMTVGKECYRYCGTPLACSVSEAGQKKGIIMVELEEKGKLSTRVIPLKPLRQVRIVEGELEEVLKQSSDNFVTVILTDKVDVNVFDMQDRLRHAFPNLLEIRRETLHKANYEMEKFRHEAELDAFSLCCEFIGEMNEEEREILKEVINKVEEESEL